MSKFPIIIHTDGAGFWTKQAKAVKVTGIEFDDESVLVYFDPETWNVKKDGLIYTDDGFLHALKKACPELKNADYSEQGLQGDNFVHLDAESYHEEA